MATAATLSPADSEKLSKLQSAVSGLHQIRFVFIILCLFFFEFVVLWYDTKRGNYGSR